jgi:small-conductance mechanosensitive channel
MTIIEYFTLANVLKIVVIIASAYIVSKIFEIIFIKTLQKRKKERGMIIPLKRVTSIIIYIIAFISILLVFNIDITAAAAGLGIGAIVIGFGLKDVISNWISGVIIITGGIYRIDDAIRVGDITGVVTDITLRSTILKTYDRNEVIIPNSTMINEKVINLTAGRRQLISSIIFLIDYTSDTDKAKKIIEDVLKKNENVIVDEEGKREIRFIVRTKEWTTEIETLFWINRPGDEEFIKSRITESVKKEFEKKNILPPLPVTMRGNRLKSRK